LYTSYNCTLSTLFKEQASTAFNPLPSHSYELVVASLFWSSAMLRRD